ncbi:GH15 family glucan-1,4-alpha-glucosidase [Cryobacterium sp. CAN_C3]|uniref:glycoside hydrolase family 15 protein n=1 Tax=unclassified Cryobacterium TaxID=2649013 RepID=UPI0018C9C4FE|nr:glycoside hydrolase family 15 protein [Cryobacterium sp. CAN_C3]MEC5155927.1 GH15 family glucan-1,4-alpha-glucosidase [Cryobacterium sp. CAN_C3]
MSDLPIADHALLSDRHSAALVAREGSIVWLCFPRFDSESVFASILDDDAGYWSIRPTAASTSTRSYVAGTMALQTTFHTDEGTLELIDALELGAGADPHRLGENAPHTLLRGVHCTSGRVTVEMVCRPRPEYGLVVPVFAEIDSGVVATGGSGRLTLSLPAPVTGLDGEIRVQLTLEAGQHRYFALQRTRLGEPLPGAYTQDEIAAGLAVTTASWQEWSAIHQSYDGPWRELVHHSGRVLQALSYQPTGAIVAAATTSLPEEIGGERNWDYRYSWVRDASFTMKALWVAACPDEAHEFFDFITAAAAHSRPERHLQIMFGIGGEHDLAERVLPQLTGWRGSGPVRVGNGAWDQPQLDVYGELLDSAFRLRGQLGEIQLAARTFLIALADAAASQWQQPDNGIWEVRGAPRHFLYSKLMCWVALDRAIAMAEQLHATDRIAQWSATAAQIRATILEKGWNEEASAFTQSFDSSELDASSLMMSIVGFLPASDPRVLATADAIIERLTDARGLVYRYQTDTGVDGLDGHEGTFLLCTFWLAQVLADGGRLGEAREVFERAVSHVNDVGLLAEEVDSETGEQLGNFPQAFSHVGLINAAWAIKQAESGYPADERLAPENAP